MVLTREELVSSLQNEVRILLHLAGKVDRAQLDYRPSPGQRSTLELLQYLTVMGPGLVAFIRAGVFDWPDGNPCCLMPAASTSTNRLPPSGTLQHGTRRSSPNSRTTIFDPKFRCFIAPEAAARSS